MEWLVYSFDLPLISGSRRKGLVFRLTGTGEDRWGEIAPWPGRSKETLSEAFDQLVRILTEGKIQEELFPSVQFGLESALAFPPPKGKASLYAFLNGSPSEVLQQADTAFANGYSSVKFKISSLSKTAAIELIHALKDRFRLRVDCNRAFSFADAMSIFSPFDPSTFEYIEDPTFEMETLSDFSHPFALDEVPLLNKYPNLYGFILKPTVLGGKKGCTPFIAFAKKNQLQVVLSPTFESGLGLLQIFSLAHHFELLEQPIGMDTHRYLAQDLLLPGVDFNSPLFSLNHSPEINTELLKEIAHGTCQLPHL